MSKTQRSYKRVSLPELQYTFEMLGRGAKIREIARNLGRSSSTVSSWKNKYCHKNINIWKHMNMYEKARHVFDKMGVKKQLNRCEPIRDINVKSYVISRLAIGDTPEHISATMADELNGKKVCFKTIYNLTKKRRGLKKYLREEGKKRRQKVKPRQFKKKQGAPKVRSIHKRGKKVNDRKEIGHFEGDLIITKKGGSKAILTLLERLSRKKWFILIPDTKAKTVLSYMLPVFLSLPEGFIKSLTLDNGSEFTYSEIIKLESKFSDFLTYYCDPYSSYQKGAVERANRDFRRYFPKGTDFGEVSRFEVKSATRELNNTPLKCLNWETPNKIFNFHLEEFTKSNPLVA
jgi:IS30 family transposase